MASASRQPGLQELLRKVASDGARWFDAEVALARAQTDSTFSGYVTSLILAVTAIVVLFVTLVVFSQAAILGFAPYFGSLLMSALAVGIVLLILAVVLGAIAWQTLKSSNDKLPIVQRLSNERP
jgi:hypothetical protein